MRYNLRIFDIDNINHLTSFTLNSYGDCVNIVNIIKTAREYDCAVIWQIHENGDLYKCATHNNRDGWSIGA